MASDVDICNLALSFLGDTAAVTNLNPPDSTVQAGHCARFYPVARDALLELHPWGFATVRVTLAQVAAAPPNSWQYAYAVPSNAINLLAVLDPNAIDDYSASLVQSTITPGIVPPAMGSYTPQPFVVEALSDGTDVLYTDQQNAVLRYTTHVTDTSKFSPLFVVGLAKLLASMVAGPLLKGETGAKMAKQMEADFNAWYAQATESDANQRRTQVAQRAPWMAGR